VQTDFALSLPHQWRKASDILEANFMAVDGWSTIR